MWREAVGQTLNTRGRRLAVAMAAVTLVWFSVPAEETVAAPAAVTTKAVEFSAADIAVVRREGASSGVMITGTMTPLQQTVVNAKESGQISAVLVREGEVVRKGQLLVRQDTRDLEQRLQQAEASLSAAKVEANLARLYVERLRKLNEQKYYSDVDLAIKEGEALVRAEQMKVQQAAVSVARKALADAAVTAPQGGIVAERLVEPGQIVQANAALLKIVDLGQLELVAQVQAADLARIKPGQAVQVTVEGFGNRTFEGRVVRVNPVASAGTRNIAVYANVSNRDGVLRGGLFARGVIAAAGTGEASRALLIPAAAVRQEKSGAAVFVVRDNKLVLQGIQIGARDPRAGTVSVTAGLREGERVILPMVKSALSGSAVKLPAGV